MGNGIHVFVLIFCLTEYTCDSLSNGNNLLLVWDQRNKSKMHIRLYYFSIYVCVGEEKKILWDFIVIYIYTQCNIFITI